MKFSARDRLKLLAGASALALTGCGGSNSSSAPISGSTPSPAPPPPPPPPTGGIEPGLLKNSFDNNFTFGTAMANTRLSPVDQSATIALDQFSSITPEYELKLNNIAPTAGVLDFDAANRVVDWALGNGMQVRGHALVWHEATPDYFLQGSRTDIQARLEDYIANVIGEFRDRISIWDVANEVVSVDIYSGNSGIGPDRRTSWFDAVGNADYLDWAFRAARAADPNAQLFLSDYQTEDPLKQDWLLEILRRLIDRGVPIDGVGHQFHIRLDTAVDAMLGAIDAVEDEFPNFVNHITEMDMNFYQDPGTCWESQTNCQPDIGPTPPADQIAQQAQMLRDIFNGFVLRPSIENVSFWGVRDSDSWLNFVPVERYNYPLLFDRDGNPKPCLHAITDPNYEI
ncbi:MAG: endo-1,4-beta-xylanase [Acidimicrobiales bacterium]|nr:endo-1,4-beta-xylanase [Hyphomonadaceae bacterium]RZV44461.1 MAG: endo-1,4-beta-xylanase [Acidimicrobiales bacterium]